MLRRGDQGGGQSDYAEKPPRLRSRINTTTTMAQKRRQTKNNKKPLGRRSVSREEGTLAEDLLSKAKKRKEKGSKYQG